MGAPARPNDPVTDMVPFAWPAGAGGPASPVCRLLPGRAVGDPGSRAGSRGLRGDVRLDPGPSRSAGPALRRAHRLRPPSLDLLPGNDRGLLERAARQSL